MAINLNVSELDFNEVKTNLKEFLRTQEEFQDYNFEGSNISTMLDVLAYTTVYNGVYANAAVNESFLDSAQLRNSVVSHAKSIGYTPTSVTSPGATIQLRFKGIPEDQSITIKAGTKFVGLLEGVSYPFVTKTTETVGHPHVLNVQIFQGEAFSKTYTWSTFDKPKLLLRETDIDRNSITVEVENNTWSMNNGDISDLTGDDRVFFVQENENQISEVYFGPSSNLFGAVPNNEDNIVIKYLRTRGSASNGCFQFSIPGLVAGFDSNTVSIAAIDAAMLGTDAETIEQLKFRAPKNYESQGRIITVDDYKSAIKHNFTDLEAINVWGGEENDPPEYGKVLISIKPKTGRLLTTITKERIVNEILKPYNVVSVKPVIVDPEYLYVDVTSNVKYARNNTTRSAGDIINIVAKNIKEQFNINLKEFGSVLKYSSIVGLIDQSEESIRSNITKFKMIKKFQLGTNNRPGLYNIKFRNSILPGSINSNSITSGDTSYIIMDDGAGTMMLYNKTLSGFVNLDMGNVNYETGEIFLKKLTLEILQLNLEDSDIIDINQEIEISSEPAETDIYSKHNLLVIFNRAIISTDFA